MCAERCVASKMQKHIGCGGGGVDANLLCRQHDKEQQQYMKRNRTHGERL